MNAAAFIFCMISVHLHFSIFFCRLSAINIINIKKTRREKEKNKTKPKLSNNVLMLYIIKPFFEWAHDQRIHKSEKKELESYPHCSQPQIETVLLCVIMFKTEDWFIPTSRQVIWKFMALLFPVLLWIDYLSYIYALIHFPLQERKSRDRIICTQTAYKMAWHAHISAFTLNFSGNSFTLLLLMDNYCWFYRLFETSACVHWRTFKRTLHLFFLTISGKFF